MLTLSPKTSNPWNNMSWSSHVSPRTSPTRTHCSWPLTLPAFAGNLSCPLLSNSLRARTVHSHPGRHARARGAPDRPRHAHANPLPPRYAPVPHSPCTSPTQARLTLPATASSHSPPIRGHGPSPAPSPCHMPSHASYLPPPARSTSPSSSAGEEREKFISVP